jgi:hypothetical protein
MFFKKNKDKNKNNKSKQTTDEDRAALIARAKENAAAARAEIGDETLDRIREAMMKKQNSPVEKARAKLMALDKERLADNIRAVRDDDE